MSTTDDTIPMEATPRRTKIKKIIRKRPARPQVASSLFPSDLPPDGGFTKADELPESYRCLFFARGICPPGSDCSYLHRLPRNHFHDLDCSGRAKFVEFRDDTGGVGSLTRMSRTIYVGRIHVTDNIEEAMAHQSLDNDETLNVRWAAPDPNPLAQKREAHYLEEQAAETISRILSPEIKKRKVGDNFNLEGYEAPEKLCHVQTSSDSDAALGSQEASMNVDNPGIFSSSLLSVTRA
ncbi:RNA recognition domain-containing protein [Xylaria acuta]|nr:RNA recognition domain-containing protein [Xylaria acuta]